MTGTQTAPTRDVAHRPSPEVPVGDRRDDRRRFTNAVLRGATIAAVPFVWLLWNGRLAPLRSAIPGGNFSNFYDLQARAMFHGNLAIPPGHLGIEAFLIHGKEYMYFGPFPALLRMPILAITSSLDGKLTAPSMLLAWIVTAVFAGLLLWRVRILLRGDAPVTLGESVSVTVLIATILGGSVLLYLASLPWVYHEAFSWSVALATGASYALLGVLERPSTRRVVLLSALIVGAALSRTTAGYGLIIAVGLTAAWFGFGRAGDANRRWWRPVALAGLVPLAIGAAVNWLKFQSLFGLPSSAQIYSKLNAHRRAVLAMNGDSLFHPRYLPSTIWAYFRPTGLRLTSLYPFITLPAIPARGVAGAVLDQTYRTASLPATTPLLVLLAIAGVVVAFRPRAGTGARMAAIAILGAAAITSGVMIQAYISERYLAEFLPFLIVASCVGLAALWRALDGRGARLRRGVVAAIAALGGFSIVANAAVASTPTDPYTWRVNRVHSYVSRQQDLADVTGHPTRVVLHGARLPAWAPADQLFVLGNCDALYISTGEFEGPWIPAEFRQPNVDLTFGASGAAAAVPVVTVGSGRRATTLSVERDRSGRVRFRVNVAHARPSGWHAVERGHRYLVSIVEDTAARPLFPSPDAHYYVVNLDGSEVLHWWSQAHGAQVVHGRGGSATAPLTVAPGPTTPAYLCERVVRANRPSR